MPEKSTDYNTALVDGNFTTPRIHQTIYVLSSFLRLETGRYLYIFFFDIQRLTFPDSVPY